MLLKNRKKGFTLIELIVTIAVLVIIAAIALPAFSSLKEKSKDRICKANLSAVKRVLTIENMTTSSMTPDAIDQAIQREFSNSVKQGSNYTGICPDEDGAYRVSIQGDVITVTCSKHGESSQTVISNHIDKLIHQPILQNYFAKGKTELNSTGVNFGQDLKKAFRKTLNLETDDFDFRVYQSKSTGEYHVYIFENLKNVNENDTISATKYYWNISDDKVTRTEVGTASVMIKQMESTQTNKKEDYKVLNASEFKIKQ